MEGDLEGLPAVRDWPVVRGCDAGDVIRPIFRHLLRWYPIGGKPGAGDRELLAATVRAMVYAFVLGKEGTAEVDGVFIRVLESDGRRVQKVSVTHLLLPSETGMES